MIKYEFDHLFSFKNGKLEDWRLIYIPTAADTDMEGYENVIENAKQEGRHCYFITYDLFSVLEKGELVPAVKKIPRGKNIHGIGDLPYAVDDIRKYYNIKRSEDKCDYNVLGSIKIGNNYSHEGLYYWIKCKKLNTIFGFNYNNVAPVKKDLIRKINLLYPDIEEEDLEFSVNYTAGRSSGYSCLSVYFISDFKHAENIYQLFTNTWSHKPIISAKDLDLDSSMEMSLDTINILYQALIQKYNYDNIKMQISLLGQYNWRKYTGTLNLVFRSAYECCHGYEGIRDYLRVPSKFSKTEKMIMNECWGEDQWVHKETKFTSQDDFDMGLKFAESMLGIGDCKFVDRERLEKRLEDAGISDENFNRLYNHVVRVKPKTFEDYMEYEKEISKDDKEDDEEEDDD